MMIGLVVFLVYLQDLLLQNHSTPTPQKSTGSSLVDAFLFVFYELVINRISGDQEYRLGFSGFNGNSNVTVI